jgi:hypothetical protein
MANIKFSQFTTTSPSDTVSLVGYLSTDNVKFTIADLKTQFNNSYVTLNTTQSITSTKQFTTFPILGDQSYTASYGSEVKLYSSHNADSSWIFNSVGVHDKIFSFRVNDLHRWAFSVNQDAETGSNAGTNFEIRRYNDAGTFIDSPISITRSNGTVAFGGNIQLTASMNLGDGVTLSNGELQTLDGISTSGTIQQQLNSKVNSNSAITGATKTKITYDSKGLVTAGADITIADLPTTLPVGYSSPVVSIVSGGVITETQLTTITIPAGAFKNGDNILSTFWATRTSGASTGINTALIIRITNSSGTQIVSVSTGNRHNNFTLNARVLSDTSIIWWPNSATASAVTTTTPSLSSSGFTIYVGVTRTNTTDEVTLYNSIIRKYS